MKKKIIALILAVTILVGGIVGGTLAYLSDTDSAVNVATVGNVKIKQHQLQRAEGVSSKGTLTEGDLIPYEQAQKLYPAYATPGAELPYYAAGMDDLLYWGPYVTAAGAGNGLWMEEKLTGAIDSFIFVENTGKSDAYYRTFIALECPEGAEYSETPDKDFIFNSNGHRFFDTKHMGYKTIGGVRYYVLAITYKEILKPGEIARPSLLQVVMTENADNAVTEACGETYEILAFTEAVQVENMPDAFKALNAAFGDPDAGYLPWAEDVKPSKTVYNLNELVAALNNGTDVVLLGADIEVNGALTLGADKVLAGNGHVLYGASLTVGDDARIENVVFEGAYGSAANVSVDKTSASVYKCTFAVNSMLRANQTYIDATLTSDNQLVLKANTFHAGGIVDIEVVDEVMDTSVVTAEDNVALAESWEEAEAMVSAAFAESMFGKVINAKEEEVPAIPKWAKGGDTSWYDPNKTEFILTTEAQLVGLSDLVNNGTDTFAGKTIKLAADLDFYAYDTVPGGDDKDYYFTPIGKGLTDNFKAFKGTFDGDGHTISNMYQEGWAYYADGAHGLLGLFGAVEDATIKNLTIEDALYYMVKGVPGGVVGMAKGDCVFDNITVAGTTVATTNNACGGVVGYLDEGNYSFTNIRVEDDTVVAGLWGNYDVSSGGVVGGISSTNASASFKDVFVAARIDAYNDATANNRYFLYRYSGMLVGYIDIDQEINGKTYPNPKANNITCENVTVVYGDWVNYHYCEVNGEGQKRARVESGYRYAGFDPAACTHAGEHCDLLVYDQIFGGDWGVRGLAAYNGVAVVYNKTYTPATWTQPESFDEDKTIKANSTVDEIMAMFAKGGDIYVSEDYVMPITGNTSIPVEKTVNLYFADGAEFKFGHTADFIGTGTVNVYGGSIKTDYELCINGNTTFVVYAGEHTFGAFSAVDNGKIIVNGGVLNCKGTYASILGITFGENGSLIVNDGVLNMDEPFNLNPNRCDAAYIEINGGKINLSANADKLFVVRNIMDKDNISGVLRGSSIRINGGTFRAPYPMDDTGDANAFIRNEDAFDTTRVLVSNSYNGVNQYDCAVTGGTFYGCWTRTGETGGDGTEVCENTIAGFVAYGFKMTGDATNGYKITLK